MRHIRRLPPLLRTASIYGLLFALVVLALLIMCGAIVWATSLLPGPHHIAIP